MLLIVIFQERLFIDEKMYLEEATGVEALNYMKMYMHLYFKKIQLKRHLDGHKYMFSKV